MNRSPRGNAFALSQFASLFCLSPLGTSERGALTTLTMSKAIGEGSGAIEEIEEEEAEECTPMTSQ